jgi:translation initiation factor IF-1
MGATIGTMSQYAAMPFNEGEYPDARWVDRLSLGLIKELPSRSSGYITSYFENAKTINQAMADMRHYAALGQTEKVLEIQEEKMDKLKLFRTYEKVGKIMGNIRKQIRIIEKDKTMTGAEKKQAINQMTVLMSEYAKMAEDIRKSMKGG